MLQKSILLTFALFITSFLHAQLDDGSIAPDFTVTDLDGEEHSLYPILESGKSVMLDFSATWCGICWNYHNSHAIEDAFTTYGPDGMDIARAFFLEADSNSNDDCVLGNSMCNTSTIGDWTAGTSYPVVNLTGDELTVKSDYDVSGFPTIIAIAPNKKMYETGRITAAVWSSWLTETLALDGSTVVTGNTIDLTVSGGFGDISYEWSNGETTEDISDVDPGTYSVTVTEGRGHSIELMDIVVSPPVITIACPSNGTTSCFANNLLPFTTSTEFEAAGGQITGIVDATSFTFVSEMTDGNSCPEILTRTYSIADSDGNSVQCEQQIIILDEIAPSLISPADMTLENLPTPYSSLSAYTDAGGSATDNCEVDPSSLQLLSETIDESPCSIVNRVYSISDQCGNSSTASQNFRIGLSDDAVVNYTFSNTGLDYEFFEDANFGDEYEWTVNGASSSSSMNYSVSFPNVGIYEVCLTVNSPCGSQIFCQDIDAKIDGVSVSFACPDQVDNLCSIDEAPAFASVEEYENGGGAISGDYEAASFELLDETTNEESCPETIFRTYRVLDINGDIYTCQHVLTINDEESPVMSTLSSLLVSSDTDQVYETVADFYNAAGTLEDNCGLDDSSFTLLSQNVEMDGPCTQLRRVYTIGDACGNMSTAEQAIYVELSDEAEVSFTTDVTELTVNFNLTSNFGNEYEWMFGDGGLAEVENPVYTYSEDGMYEVCVTVFSPCGSKQYCASINVTIINTDEYEQDAQLIAVSPNPAHNYMHVEIDKTVKVDDIQLLSIDGKITAINASNSNSQNILLPDLHAGIYFLRVRSGNEFRYKKIMIQ